MEETWKFAVIGCNSSGVPKYLGFVKNRCSAERLGVSVSLRDINLTHQTSIMPNYVTQEGFACLPENVPVLNE